MGSEMQAIGGMHSSFRRLMEQKAAREAWEAANPELAAAWGEASREDYERDQRKQLERRNQHWDAEVPRALAHTGLPLDCLEALAGLRTTPAVEAAKRFLRAPRAADGRFLVLLGKKGTGKTTAAAVVARGVVREWVEEREMSAGLVLTSVPVQFVLATTFSRLSGYDREDKEWFEQMCRVRLLVLDDFGSEHLNDFGRSMLDEMLTRRHGDRLRTVITTNLGRREFAVRVGERLFDRISTSGMSAVINEDSMRKKPGAA